MSPLPEFHTAAVKQARERIEKARAEVTAANACMDDIDRILNSCARSLRTARSLSGKISTGEAAA